MTDASYIDHDLFDGGPPMRLQRTLGLVKPGQPRVGRRAVFVVLIGWAPLAVLVTVQALAAGQSARAFFSDFAVHARFLIAAPILIIAEADCLHRLGRIVIHFVEAGLVSGSDMDRFHQAASSTRRLLDSSAADAIATVIAYVAAISLIAYVTPQQLPEWQRRGLGGYSDLSPAGWWHMFVSLPLLLVLLIGWLWRLLLWARFLILMARLELRLVPSHPDHAGGLNFVSTSLRGFRLIAFALGTLVAGTAANRVLHEGHTRFDFKNLAIGLVAFNIVIFAGPLTVFLRRLRVTKERGIFRYGALTGFVGAQFEGKWLAKPGAVDAATLEAPDFSATTDLYSVTANVYEMKDVPFGWKDLIYPFTACLVPFIPVVLLTIPLQALIEELVKLLL